jgi:predicted GNAT family acetyltransferase
VSESPVVARYADAGAFLADAGPYLVAREAEHNLLLGIAGRLRSASHLYGAEPYLACVMHGGSVVGVAVRTPPYNLILSELRALTALPALVEDVVQVYEALPGVIGPKEASRRFAELWAARSGSPARPGMTQRIYRASVSEAPHGVRGSMRRATNADRGLLVDWAGAFTAEALPGAPASSPAEAVDDRLGGDSERGLRLWEDGHPVSMAGYGGPTPSGIRIGPVYTPPAERGRGYASALVAELTGELLASGRRFCFLFADLENATSNRIYERIGYRPVTDVDEYRFG